MFQLRDRIRRASRNTALLYLLWLVLLSACWFPFLVPWVKRAALGPVQANGASIDSLSVSAEPLVTLAVQRPDHVATRRSGRTGSVSAEFYLVPAGAKQLLVCTAAGPEPSGSVTGVLTSIEDKLQSDLADRERFAQGMLDTRYGRYTRWWAHLLIGLTWLLLLRTVMAGFREWLEPARHPEFRRLGSARVDQLDADMSKACLHIGPLSVSAGWLVRSGATVLQVIALEDLMWAYHKVTRHRTNGIPTGTTYEIVLHARDGRTCNVSGKEKACREMLDSLAREVPWIIFGYSDELNKQWGSDRAGFLIEVDRRRSAYAEPGAVMSENG